jgi:hypothetical protein
VVIDIRRRPDWALAAAAVVIGLGKEELPDELLMLLELFGFEKKSPRAPGFKERRR